MQQSIKKQNKLRTQKKVFHLAWNIAREKHRPISKALHEAWIIYQNKTIILPYVLTSSRSSNIDPIPSNHLTISF